MREAIRRALASPPPRGAVVVIAIGLLVTFAAIALSKDPGGSGEDVAFQSKANFAESPTAPLRGGGNGKIVDGVVSNSAANDLSQRIYRIEASFRVRAAAGQAIGQVRCQLTYPKGVALGISEGRNAAFPRPLEDTSDDAIKEATDVEYDTSDSSRAAVLLRNAFFKYVIGGNPSVTWPSLAEGQNAWLWRFKKPVERTRVNFAVLAISKGGKRVPMACTAVPPGTSATLGPGRSAHTSVKLSD